jgi:hypothetical protein
VQGGLLRLRDRALRGGAVVLLAALAAFATTATAGAADGVGGTGADEPLHTQPMAASGDDETVTATNVLVASAVPEVHGTLVQTIQTPAFSPSSPDPAGITYIPESDRLLVSDSEVDEMAIYQGFNFFTVTRTGSGVGTGTSLAFSREPTGITYDPSTKRLFVADDDADRISVVSPGTDGVHGTPDDIWTRFGTAAFGSTDAEGLAYDQASGHLFICDGLGTEIYELDPVNGVFGDAGDVAAHFDIGAAGAVDCEGVALDAARGALLVIDPSTARIYEFTIAGAFTRIIRLTAIPTQNTIFADLVLAPSSDPNDHPSKSNLWIVDRHVDNGTDPNENDGLLYEISLPDDAPSPPPDTVVAGPSGTWVRPTATFSLSSTPSGASFECRIDGGAWAACSTPYNAATVVPGRYVFEFRAVGAGGADASPALRELRVVRPSVADWDGDGKANVALWRPAVGGWYVKDAGTSWWGWNGDVPVPGQWDADPAVDRAIFRPDHGGWYVEGNPTRYHGRADDVPVPADWNGDGVLEPIVWRPDHGGWYVHGVGTFFFGARGDVPVLGDYDADPQLDLAVFRAGAWYVEGSATVFHGLPGDIPVPADWDGNGKTDMAVYRPSNGTWYVRDHSVTQFGASDMVPLVGDFDADPAIDRVVWHADTGTWYVEGSAPLSFGLGTDIP